MDILLWLDPNFGKKKINFFVLLDFFRQKKFYVLPQINFIYIYIYELNEIKIKMLTWIAYVTFDRILVIYLDGKALLKTTQT